MEDMVDITPDNYPYPYPTGPSDYWPEQRGPKGVSRQICPRMLSLLGCPSDNPETHPRMMLPTPSGAALISASPRS